MYVRIKKSGPRQYLQIVESIREGKKVRQRVIANLGRYDELIESGEIDNLMISLSRHTISAAVISAVHKNTARVQWDKEWGVDLIFSKIWKDLKLSKIIKRYAKGHHYKFDVERAIYAAVLQRLCSPGSDLYGSKWLEGVYAPGFEDIQLQHLYRVMEFLAKYKERIEEDLYFSKSRGLFDIELDMVFFDTTSLYFEGEGFDGFTERGYSKDHRPECHQVLVGVIMTREGIPLCCEFWPGSTSDIKTVKTVIERLKGRFQLRRIIFVADRGMVSKENIGYLEDEGIDYILGVRLRKLKEVREEVLSRGGKYSEAAKNLKVKEVTVNGTRYIVCLNPEEAIKDKMTREAIVADLKEKLKKGPKALVGNKGYKKYLKIEKDSINLNLKKVQEESRFDGKFVLITNTELTAKEVAKAYKGLWRIEYGFRNLKDILKTRPIYHRKEDNIKGHIFASFLSLVLMIELKKRMEDKGIEMQWDEVIRDIKALRAIKLTHGDKCFIMRPEFKGKAYDLFKAAGVRPPSAVSEVNKSVVPQVDLTAVTA